MQFIWCVPFKSLRPLLSQAVGGDFRFALELCIIHYQKLHLNEVLDTAGRSNACVVVNGVCFVVRCEIHLQQPLLESIEQAVA